MSHSLFRFCAVLALGVSGASASDSARDPLLPVPVSAPESPAPTSSTGPLSALIPGDLLTFQIPLSPAEQKLTKEERNPGADTATVGIRVPPGFTPDKKWPILVVFTTSDGDFSHVNRLRAFAATANSLGWVVLAADGPVKPPHISTEWCWAMLSAGFAELEKAWPDVTTWPIACGGNSGGAKISALMAARMASEKLPVIGVFMGGCNEDMLTIGVREFHPPSTFKKIAIFLSGGQDDKIARPAEVSAVAASIKKSGFRNVRQESFAGGHRMNDDHVAQALEWFAAESAKP